MKKFKRKIKKIDMKKISSDQVLVLTKTAQEADVETPETEEEDK